MKSFIVALVFAFALTANCGMLKSVPQMEPALSLAQIDQHPLGKSFLSLAALHMRAGGNVETLGELLENIGNDLVRQNEENEATWTARHNECETEIAKLLDRLAFYGKDYTIASQIVQETELRLRQLRIELDDALALRERTIQDLQAGETRRNAQHETYVADLADNEAAIEGVNQAIPLVNSLRAGTSFVQLKGRMQKATQKLEQSKSAKHAHIYAPLLKALAQITSKGDQETIERIASLLQTLSEQLAAAKVTIQETEDSQAATWATEKALLTKTLGDTDKRILQLRDDIKKAEEERDAAAQRMADDLVTLKADHDSLVSREAQCSTWAEEYEHTKEVLTSEIAIMRTLSEHFHLRIAGITEYITSAPGAL